MGRIEAVIFDWAGTTVDYGCFAPVQAFTDMFAEFGLTPSMDEIRKPMGMLKREHIKTVLSMSRIANQFLEVYKRDVAEDDIDRMNAAFEGKLMTILSQFAAPKPYVQETVEALRQKGIKIGSTTGYTDEMMKIVTEKAKEQGYCPDAWFSPNATGNIGRPYPYMIFKNMMELNIGSVDAVIKVGDTVSDILEGKAAGVITVGIVEGSSESGLTEEEFSALTAVEKAVLAEKIEKRYRDAGADYVVNDIRGVLELI